MLSEFGKLLLAQVSKSIGTHATASIADGGPASYWHRYPPRLLSQRRGRLNRDIGYSQGRMSRG